jgi:hypothetical protein
MSQPARPAPVTIVAVLQLVFGVLSLCGGVFALGGLFSGAMVVPAAPGGTAPGPFDWNEEMDREAPGYKASVIWGNVAYVLLGLVMVFGGVGLLKLWRGSRALNLAWAVIFILLSVAEVVYTFAVLLPASNRLIAAQAAGTMTASFCTLMHWTLIGNALYTAAMLAYPVAVLVLLGRPSVGRALADARPAGVPEEGWEEPAPSRAGGEDDRPARRDERIRE